MAAPMENKECAESAGGVAASIEGISEVGGVAACIESVGSVEGIH